MRKKGFTLVELLVVIAIIAILGTLASISLLSARAKARDAKRISDVKQLSTLLELEAVNSPNVALTGCTGANALTSTCTGTLIGTETVPGEVVQFSTNTAFKDPSSPTAPICTCSGTAPATCAYTISKKDGTAGALVDNYRICFRLEKAAGNLTEGYNCIKTGAQMVAGCL